MKKTFCDACAIEIGEYNSKGVVVLYADSSARRIDLCAAYVSNCRNNSPEAHARLSVATLGPMIPRYP